MAPACNRRNPLLMLAADYSGFIDRIQYSKVFVKVGLSVFMCR